MPNKVTNRVTDKVLILVTCANAAEANRIARAIVESRLAACVNVLPGSVRSIYRWQGKVESARETLLLIKSSKKVMPKLQSAIKRLHSYDNPEIIAVAIVKGSKNYLAWIDESL